MDFEGRKRAAVSPIAGGVRPEWLVTVLPSCLIMDILSRLPIKTLFNCKCVCKTWLNLISDPYFVDLQIARSPPAILIKNLRRHGESRQLLFAQMTEANTKSRFLVEKFRFNSEHDLPTYDFRLINSCNGLLCLTGGRFPDCLFICNPILFEHISIPLPNTHGVVLWGCNESDLFGFGFGFCASTNQYKVVHTFTVSRKESGVVKNYQEAAIYTIGTGKWRRIGTAPCKISPPLPINSFLNGSIHWIYSPDPDGERLVYAFDFGSELFRLIPLPYILRKKYKGFMMMGILTGCLCISYSYRRRCELWVMKDYGVKDSWAKMFVIQNLCLSKINHKFCEPIIAYNNGKILMLCDNAVLACYNTKTKRLTDAKISRTNGEFHIIFHIPCFISPSDIVKGGSRGIQDMSHNKN